MTETQDREFDYVVVGGGSSGAATAARLSEKNPEAQVALIEAGPDDEGIDEVLALNRWMELLESGYDWDYPVEE
ncbi:MAG: GMC family oxidoreductase N-terminal domain-containing protein, partial [Kocuria sp.]|nr:GMC family oxidoreductase N-terminal domain-containing protein [Kocuria sp.]